MKFLQNKFVVVGLFGILPAICIWLYTLNVNHPFQRLNTLVFDTYQRVLPRDWAGSDITIVDIDEASIKKIGQWPWPRTTIADLTDRLGELGAAAIVFDVIFSEPDRTSPISVIENLKKSGVKIELPSDTGLLDNDVSLARAFERNLVISGMRLSEIATDDPPRPKAGHGFSGTEPAGHMRHGVKALRNLPILDEAASGIGELSFLIGNQSDGVVRRAQLLRPANGSYYPVLAMETLRILQGAGGFKIKSSDGSGEIGSGKLAIVSNQVGYFEVPTDAEGAMAIYHSMSSSKPTVSAMSVLLPDETGVTKEALAGDIANHIVLIGTSAEGLLDLRSTPLEPSVPGVMVHAEMMDQILSETYLSRPDIAPGIELSISIVAVLMLLLFLPRLDSITAAILALVLLGLVTAGCWYMFAERLILLSPVVPVFSVLAAYLTGIAALFLITEREGRFVRNAFGLYLSPTMVEKLASNPGDLVLGGEERELTVLFCDIRGFTSLSEGMNPTELTTLLNDFLTPMTTVLLNNGATIDKYMGDAIMAFWNAPLDQDNHRRLGCQSLLDMKAALETLNKSAPRQIRIGVGLNTGPCCVGNLGSSQRFSYSAIGDAVNVASRIEGQTKFYGVDNLVARETVDIDAGFAVLEIDRVAVVGRSEPLTVCTVLGDRDLADSELFQLIQKLHQQMISAYQSGDIDKAFALLSELENVADNSVRQSLSGVYALYRDRVSLMRKEGVPVDWDGVYTSTSK